MSDMMRRLSHIVRLPRVMVFVSAGLLLFSEVSLAENTSPACELITDFRDKCLKDVCSDSDGVAKAQLLFLQSGKVPVYFTSRFSSELRARAQPNDHFQVTDYELKLSCRNISVNFTRGPGAPPTIALPASDLSNITNVIKEYVPPYSASANTPYLVVVTFVNHCKVLYASAVADILTKQAKNDLSQEIQKKTRTTEIPQISSWSTISENDPRATDISNFLVKLSIISHNCYKGQ